MNAAGNNTNNDERPGKSVGDPEWRKALHPVVTGSHFHQTRVATDKEEYPRLHEFGKRIKLGLPEAIPMRRVRP
jgi:hypothetical protein